MANFLFGDIDMATMIRFLLLTLYSICKDLEQLNWDAIAALSAVIACSISMYQISEERKLSNQQILFDKRTDIVILLFELLKCKNNAVVLFTQKDDDGLIIVWDMAANYLTETAEMQDVYNAYSNLDNANKKRKLLIAVQKLKETGYKSKLIFPEPIGTRLYNFFVAYGELLMALYRYVVAAKRIEEVNKKWSPLKQPKPNKKVQEIVKCEYNEVYSEWNDLQKAAEAIKGEEIDTYIKLV